MKSKMVLGDGKHVAITSLLLNERLTVSSLLKRQESLIAEQIQLSKDFEKIFNQVDRNCSGKLWKRRLIHIT